MCGGLAQANGLLMRFEQIQAGGHYRVTRSHPAGRRPWSGTGPIAIPVAIPEPTPCHASGCIAHGINFGVLGLDWARLINCHLTRGVLFPCVYFLFSLYDVKQLS